MSVSSKLIVEIVGKKYSDGTSHTIGFSDVGVTTKVGAATSFSYYPPVITNGVLFEQKIDNYNDGISIQLINDGSLDYLRNYAFNGHSVKLYISNEQKKTGLFFLIFTGTIDSLLVQNKKVNIVAKSHFEAFDEYCNPEVFTGVDTDFEGDTSIEGNIKPRIFGNCLNISPVSVYPTKLMFGITWDKDGDREAVTSITNVRDGGVALSFDANYTTAVLLRDATIAADSYSTCLAEGLIRLNDESVFGITCDVTHATNTYEDYISLVADETDITGYVVDGTIPSYTIGTYVTSKQKYTQVNATMREGLDIYEWFDALGNVVIFSMDRTGSSLVEFVDDNAILKSNQLPMFNIEAVKTDIPPNLIEIGYGRNFTIQKPGSLAGSVTQDKKDLYGEEYLFSTIDVTQSYAYWPVQDTVSFNTSVESSTNAGTLATLWEGILGEMRDEFEIECPILYSRAGFILGVLPAYASFSEDCVTHDSGTIKYDSNVFTMDRGYDGCSIIGTNISLKQGDLVTVTSSRFNLTSQKMNIVKIKINTKKMTVIYGLSGIRTF